MWAVTFEIKERVDMRTVMGFVALFLPTRLFACTSRPLVDAALDLTTTGTIRQRPG